VVLGPILVWLGVGEVPGFYTLVGGAIAAQAIAAACSGRGSGDPAARSARYHRHLEAARGDRR